MTSNKKTKTLKTVGAVRERERESIILINKALFVVYQKQYLQI